MTTPQEPSDPITELRAAAIQMHELYREYIKAGFSPGQSMQLVLTVLSESLRQGGGKNE